MKRGALAALVCLGGCAHHAPPPPPIPAAVLCLPTGTGLRIGETDLAELQSDAARTLLARLIPDRNRTLALQGDVPYDCAAAAIRALSRLGYRRVTPPGAAPTEESHARP